MTGLAGTVIQNLALPIPGFTRRGQTVSVPPATGSLAVATPVILTRATGVPAMRIPATVARAFPVRDIPILVTPVPAIPVPATLTLALTRIITVPTSVPATPARATGMPEVRAAWAAGPGTRPSRTASACRTRMTAGEDPVG